MDGWIDRYKFGQICM